MKNIQNSIGNQIREIRKSKKLTIEDVATKTGFTPSFISQFERDLTAASIASLQKITTVLDINMSTLFNQFEDGLSEQENSPFVIRNSEREKLVHAEPMNTIDYFLTEIGGDLEVIYSEVEVGGGSREAYLHSSNEKCIVVLHGELKLIIGEKEYFLEKGDSITFSSWITHEWKNIGSDILELIWIISHHNKQKK